MNVFFDLVAQAMAVIYAVTNNYALTIIGLTLIIMIIVTPLTLKGTRSMMVMQQLQPEMKKIQTQYKDDRQKLNEELLKFYKENDISPLGGCLPLLVQMPVFIVLYQVLRGLTRRASGMGFDFGWVSGQLGTGSGTSKPPSIDRVFDPAFLNHSTKMYTDLSQTNTMQAFGMDLAESASKALGQGPWHAAPYLILIAIVAVTGFVQQRQIQGRNPNQQVNPQQQMIMKIMPVFLPVISFGLPSGLVLYFAVSNLFRVGQQWFISRSIYGIKRGDLPLPAPDPTPAEPALGFFASLKEQFSSATNTDRDTSTTKKAAAGGASAKGASDKKSAAKPAAKSSAKKAPAQSGKPGGRASSATGAAKATSKKASSSTAKSPNGKASNGSGSGGRTSGRVTPSKASTAAAKEAPTPRSRRFGASKAEPDTTSAPDATPSSAKPSPKGGTPAGAPPTLQPRARKNKKG
jgi:YidC/Oxa1 family membrane protein insertase